MGQGVLAAGEGEPARVAAGAEDELLTLQPPPVAKRERVRVEEAGVAGAVENLHASRLQPAQHLLLLVDGVHYALCPGQQAGEVHSGHLPVEAVVDELLRVARKPRRPGEHAGRDAAVVGARPTHASALDQRDGSA